jgi:Leucine-rich repeat (LRR) protein
LIQTPKLKILQLSTNTRHLLAQHLHWVNNGYDEIKLNEVLKVINEENLFSATRLHQIERKIGTSTNTDFELEELEKLTYLYPCLINFDGNLDFIKYCVNLKELDLACLDLVDIRDLAYLKDLTNLNLCNNNINSIEALAVLENLEEVNLEYCNPLSLKPLLQHKKIRKIVLDDVENEDDIFEIISNQEACSIEYLVSNNSVLHSITFPKFWVFIYLNKEKLNISMTSIVTDKWSRFCEIPTALIEDNSFLTAYKELLNTELDKRINAVLKSNYEILEESKRYTEQEIEFEVELKIKRL